MSLFDERDMAAITSPDYPGERLIVCRNRDLARERARKREDLLAATEKDLAAIAAAVRRPRKPLRGEAEIALKVGAVVNRRKMAKHFELAIGEASFAFHRKATAIAAEAALDGVYVVRTSLPKKALDDAATVGAYKSLARVERAFRSLKTLDIHLRPIFHWTVPRVRAHVFLCNVRPSTPGAASFLISKNASLSSPTLMWWKSAVNFSFFLCFAACRMRPSACDTLSRS